jgi:cyclophilin family peptidyl-prolyl cis-trans isomerase
MLITRFALATVLAAAVVLPSSAREDEEAPVAVFETVKGTFEVEFFSDEAPKSVDHLVELIGRGFYRGLRFHRSTAGLIQVGDPQTRNMTLQNYWGNQGSGSFIGVAEIGQRKHVRGSVGLAHAGNAESADSQIYIMKRASPSLDGKHTIVGRVVSGMDVVDQLQVKDILRRVTLKEEDRP